MAWIDANAISLRYALDGTGKRPLVLIHEMGGTLEGWDGVVPLLPEGLTVLRYDMRGHGLSQKIRGTFALTDAVADLHELLRVLAIGEKVTLGGIAVGAGVALAFAAAHPERMRALVACAPATGVAPDKRAATLERIARVERDGMRDFVDRDMLPGAYPEILRNDPKRFAAFRGRQLANDPASYGATYRMLVESEFADILPRVTCPALVIAGTHDKGRSPQVTEPVAHAMPNATFMTLESGHFMAEQTPELLAAAMSDFFLST